MAQHSLSDNDIIRLFNNPGFTEQDFVLLSKEEQQRMITIGGDKPLEEAPLLGEINRIAGQGMKGIGTLLAQPIAQGLGEPTDPTKGFARASDAVSGTLTDPTTSESVGSGLGSLLSPKGVLFGRVAKKTFEGLGAIKQAILPSKKVAGAAIDTAETATGLKLRPTVEISPSKRATFLEEAANINPKRMNIQDLRDTIQSVKAVKAAASKIPETQKFAGQLENKLLAELNKRIPARVGPAKAFGRAKGREELFSKGKRVAAIGAGGAIAFQGLRRLFGGGGG